jgi:hypothetical protein
MIVALPKRDDDNPPPVYDSLHVIYAWLDHPQDVSLSRKYIIFTRLCHGYISDHSHELIYDFSHLISRVTSSDEQMLWLLVMTQHLVDHAHFLGGDVELKKRITFNRFIHVARYSVGLPDFKSKFHSKDTELVSAEFQRVYSKVSSRFGIASYSPIIFESVLNVLLSSIDLFIGVFDKSSSTFFDLFSAVVLSRRISVYSTRSDMSTALKIPNKYKRYEIVYAKFMAMLRRHAEVIYLSTKLNAGNYNDIYKVVLPENEKVEYCFIKSDYLYPLSLPCGLYGDVVLRVEQKNAYQRFVDSKRRKEYVCRIKQLQESCVSTLLLPLNQLSVHDRIEVYTVADFDLSQLFLMKTHDYVTPGFNSVVISILNNVLSALAYLHDEMRVVHRDLSAANILVFIQRDADGETTHCQAKICDLDSLINDGVVYSRPMDYCTPEYAHPGSRMKSDASHDRFAFAIIAIKLLALQGLLFGDPDEGNTYSVDAVNKYSPPGFFNQRGVERFNELFNDGHAAYHLCQLIFSMQVLTFIDEERGSHGADIITPGNRTTSDYHTLFKQFQESTTADSLVNFAAKLSV